MYGRDEFVRELDSAAARRCGEAPPGPGGRPGKAQQQLGGVLKQLANGIRERVDPLPANIANTLVRLYREDCKGQGKLIDAAEVVAWLLPQLGAAPAAAYRMITHHAQCAAAHKDTESQRMIGPGPIQVYVPPDATGPVSMQSIVDASLGREVLAGIKCSCCGGKVCD